MIRVGKNVWWIVLLAIATILQVLVPVHSMAAAGARLRQCDLPYPVHMVEGVTSPLCDDAEFEALIKHAIDLWNAASPDYQLLFYAGRTTLDHGTTCFFGDNTNLVNQIVWVANGAVLGQECEVFTGEDKEADIRIFGGEASGGFFTCSGDPGPTEFDVRKTLTHEIGHALGLTHDDATCPGSVMAPGGLLAGVAWWDTLAFCDVDKIQVLYDPAVIGSESLDISNVSVTTTFNSSTHTWDAQITFDTNLSATAEVFYGMSSDCSPPIPPCAYIWSQSGPEEINHTITLAGLLPYASFCYKITAQTFSTETECLPEYFDTFDLTGGPAEIFGLSHTSDAINCEIDASWETKFFSKNNKVFFRQLGQSTWSSVPASEPDCASNRQYSASFPVSPGVLYQYKASAKIEGVTYWSAVNTAKIRTCAGGGAPGRDIAEVATNPFIYASPNPFNPQTTITYNVRERSHVNLVIFSVDGEFVKTLVSGLRGAGLGHVTWNGTDASGREVGSGVYFVRFQAGPVVHTRKIVLLK